MEFTKESLNLENGLDKEWLITNGIGGYSSSSIIGHRSLCPFLLPYWFYQSGCHGYHNSDTHYQ